MLQKSTLFCGTTTACYYGTLYTNSSVKLAEIVSKLGQRAVIGKVNMNQNSFPEYIESTDSSLKETKKFIEQVLNLNVSKLFCALIFFVP